jgi:Glycosyl hydrolases family 2, sugar binding domain/Glycosyl hydrolases family 2/Glycosyl hydrolases family 2, TIM barrel domain
MKHSTCALILLAVIPSGVRAADVPWPPTKAPLMTRWSADVRPDRALPEYPRPQLWRANWLNLNGVWELAVAAEKEEPPFGKTLPKRILVPFPVESALSGVMKHADRLWYRRTFRVPKEWKGRTLLHFGAVDWEAKVFVNGKPMGTHRGGYDSFTIDITSALTGSGEQELVVGVWDPTDAGTQPRGKQVRMPGGIYYTPITGIWQTVWLEPVPEAYIESLKIVPDIDAKKVHITAQIAGDAKGLGIVVTCNAGSIPCFRRQNMLSAAIDGEIAEPKLWSPESPFLYDLKVALTKGDGNVDSVESYFGMRKVEVAKPDPKGPPRILLNGKEIFQVGLLDQGFWPDGLYTAPTDEALKFDIEVSKKLGFNFTRKHVKVEPARWYYWCDKLGLLVWQDMPSGDRSIPGGAPDIVRTKGSAEQFDRELGRMIDGLNNHPCIITWVVFNEGWGQFDTKRIVESVKRRDPTRLVDGVSGWNDRGVGDMHDAHIYPGPGVPPPDGRRARVLGEFGGLGLGVDGHTWSGKTWGYQGTRSKSDLTRRYEKLMQEVWKLRKEEGLCAAVYTQLTDVETEANGLFTYDRAVEKVDRERVVAVNRGDFSKMPREIILVPTSREKGQKWAHTTEKPSDDWFKTDFKDDWKHSEAGFGTTGTPGAVVRTEWKTHDIWIRRDFTLKTLPDSEPILILHHDDDAEVYINGVQAARLTGYTTDYVEVPISAEARKALKEGRNVLAVHCHQKAGGQYIDVGISTLEEKKK